METQKRSLTTLPTTPGVYFFFDRAHTVLYVGKAKNLKKRVSQYFARDDAIGPKTQQLVALIDEIKTIETVSEFDALMLEAKLIRAHQPKYNTIAKDDKSPIYVLTTKEPLPKILLIRKPKSNHLATQPFNNSLIFGPFQSGRQLRAILRHIRDIVPYCTSKVRNGRPCFYTHIGLCNPCPSVITKLSAGRQRTSLTRQYQRNISHIRALFSGKSASLLARLEKDMYAQAANNAFEKAAAIKHSIDRLRALLTYHYDPHVYLQAERAVEDLYSNELEKLKEALLPCYPDLQELRRIECIDISNLFGKQATGSLVVLADGKPDTSAYRRFRVRKQGKPNDVEMIREVLTRRLAHDEWPEPDLLIIDGGKPQVAAATTVLALQRRVIPVVGLAKRYEELIVPQDNNKWTVLTIPFANPALHVVQRIRDEAHRFALSYHRLLRRKAAQGFVLNAPRNF